MKKILSIDGGGIRGIIPGQILAVIEKEFNIKIAEEFDLIAGTSTGGILASGLLIPDPKKPKQSKFSAKQVVDLYLNNGGEIFDIPFFHKVKTGAGILDEKYPEDGLEDVLDEYFGETWLKDLLKPTLITSYDIKRRKGHFFKQHTAKKDTAYNFKVKDLARATSAAPTYFECAKIRSQTGVQYPLIDGGVFVNNPALAAYAEGRTLFKVKDQSGKNVEATAKDMKILSLGTGHSKKTYHYSKAKNWGMAQWVQPVIDIMMSGSADVAHYQLEQIYGTITQPKQYLRIDGDLKGTGIDPDMDNASPENMKKLQDFAKKILKANGGENMKKIEEWLKIK